VYYATNFVADSVFAFDMAPVIGGQRQLSELEMAMRESAKKQGKTATSNLDLSLKASKRKQEAAFDMKRSFWEEMERTKELLETYRHLIEADGLDCSSRNWSSISSAQQWSCLFRRYLATLIGLTTIGVVFSFYYRYRFNNRSKKSH
jgi:hypothetical protein